MTCSVERVFMQALAAWLWLVMAGCRHAAKTRASDDVQSSFQLIAPPTPPPSSESKASLSVDPRRQVFTDAKPILPLATPVYPAKARAAKLGLVTVAFHLTINTEGRVSEVASSLAAFSIPNAFSAEFRAAVEEAVARWRFTPASIQYLEEAPGIGGATYLRVARRETIEAVCDVQFTFTATGAVFSGVPVGK